MGAQATVLEADVDQDVGAEPVMSVDQPLASRLAIELAALVKMNLRERPRFAGGIHGEAAAGVMQEEQNAGVFLGDGGKGARTRFADTETGGNEKVAGVDSGMASHTQLSPPSHLPPHTPNL